MSEAETGRIASGRSVPPPVFLERQSYRRRRLMDAARMLPLFGVLIFAVPLLWPNPDATEITAEGVRTVQMSDAILYIFASWAVLICLSVLLYCFFFKIVIFSFCAGTQLKLNQF